MVVGKSGDGGASRYSRLGMGQQASTQAAWEEADAQELWRTVCAVTEAGDALTLGKTSDGGAVSITILSGRERLKHYAHSAEEIESILHRIRQSLEATD